MNGRRYAHDESVGWAMYTSICNGGAMVLFRANFCSSRKKKCKKKKKNFHNLWMISFAHSVEHLHSNTQNYTSMCSARL